jgi:tRNA threonylcarbamoyladenosine biosynthesis protein TsaE
MDVETFTTTTPEETMEIGHLLATRVGELRIIALQGELGSGKTHFAKGFASAFGIDPQNVNSPTYSLIQEYIGQNQNIYHIDAYRLNTTNEARSIGLDELLHGDELCLIEWPEHVRELLPEDTLWVTFTRLGEQTRKIDLHFSELST